MKVDKFSSIPFGIPIRNACKITNWPEKCKIWRAKFISLNTIFDFSIQTSLNSYSPTSPSSSDSQGRCMQSWIAIAINHICDQKQCHYRPIIHPFEIRLLPCLAPGLLYLDVQISHPNAWYEDEYVACVGAEDGEEEATCRQAPHGGWIATLPIHHGTNPSIRGPIPIIHKHVTQQVNGHEWNCDKGHVEGSISANMFPPSTATFPQDVLRKIGCDCKGDAESDRMCKILWYCRGCNTQNTCNKQRPTSGPY